MTRSAMNVAQLEHELRTYRPATMPSLPPNFVWPRYEGASVGNLAATVAQGLGASLPGALPPLWPDLLGDLLEGVERIVLVTLDSLGWEQLLWVLARRADSELARLARRGRLLPITTTFLSTTSSVLNTLWTGRPPLEHGALAFEFYLREWLMAVEAISFSPAVAPFVGALRNWGFNAEKFIPVPTVAQALKDHDVATYALTARSLVATPLSQMQYRGVANVDGYEFPSELWVKLGRMLREHRGERFFLSGYWSGVDTLGHHYGPYDTTADLEIRSIGQLLEAGLLEQLSAAERQGTLLLVTADHGQIDAPARAAVRLLDHPQLRDLLVMPPLGEARVPFFYVRSGCYTAAWNYLHTHLSRPFIYFSQQAFIESGLLGQGTPHPELEYRLGDIIGVARKDAYFVRDPALAQRLRGRHGGLDAGEMLVPLLALRLDA